MYRRKGNIRRGRGLKTSGVVYPYAYPGMAATAAAIAGRKRKGSGIAGSARASFPRELALRRARTATRWYKKRKNESVGGASQFTEKRIVTGKPEKTTLMTLARYVRNQQEPIIFRFSGMNNFNDNGYYWCGKNALTASARTDLPMYIMDLTSINNIVNGAAVTGNPLQRAVVYNTTGHIAWVDGIRQNADGTNGTATWFEEKVPTNGAAVNYPNEKSRLMWTDIRMNLFGAKNKAVKWTVQLVKFKDECLDPRLMSLFPNGSVELQRHTGFYQGLIKPYSYNPLALTSAVRVAKYMKVLKSYSTIIQAGSTTDGDTDPQVKVLKWFARWNRDLSYAERSATIGTAADLTEQADYVQQTSQNTVYTKTHQKIFLLIRASAYVNQTDATVDNTVSPSFDLCVRTCHLPQ